MSNVSGSRPRFEKIQEWEVPLRDGKCTARDVADLLRVADQQLRESLRAQGKDLKGADYDDAFYVQADEDRLYVQIRTPVSDRQEQP